MREAVGNAFLFNFIIVFLVAIIFVLISSISYSKAFKVKNRLVDIVEKYECYEETNCQSKTEIENVLGEIGYRVSHKAECETISGKTLLTATNDTNYRYCIYKNDANRGYYYSVIAYAYFEIPLVGGYFEIPIKGDTKVIYTSNGEV